MKRVTISKGGIVTHGADWPDDKTVQAWVNQCEAVKAWGHPEGWYPLALGEDGTRDPVHLADGSSNLML